MADLWPGTLPQDFQEEGFGEQRVPNTIESKPEAGAIMMRRRFTATPKYVNIQITMSATQYDTLEAFYATHQATRFQWKSARGVTRYYLFRAPPVWSTKHGIWFVAKISLLEFVTETGAA